MNANRFLIAFFAAVFFSFPRLKNVSKNTMKYSLIIGSALAIVYISANLGVQHTTLSNTSFLCGLAVVFTPILSNIIYKKTPDKKLALVIIMTTLGISFLTLRDNFSINYNNLYDVIQGNSIDEVLIINYAIVLQLPVYSRMLGDMGAAGVTSETAIKATVLSD